MRRTQVAIVGAGPAGLVLAHRLADAGIDCVVLEARDRAYVESRVRAGVLEHPTVQLLRDMGLAHRLLREGLVHKGVNLQWEGVRHRIDFEALTGKSITVYGQQELIKDLVAAWLERGGELLWEAAATGVEGIDPGPGREPAVVHYAAPAVAAAAGTVPPASPAAGASAAPAAGASAAPVASAAATGGGAIACDVVAGCDGFHGVCRAAIPADRLTVYEREYPFAWLGILAGVAPSSEELVYSCHPRGFALHSQRSPSVSRLYLQVEPDEDLAAWSDERIWDELKVRLGCEGWTLSDGPVMEKGITPMRSFVAEPLRYGRLFLAGDAAHIVPPTGAKGLNLAVADVKVLADALVDWYRRGDTAGLDAYSETCLRRVWRVQDFSTFMTELLHVGPGDSFDRQLQRARQRYVATSTAMASALAENYVGLPLP